MQIVSGKYRHRKLESNPGETTRPITARVKVALFDRLQPDLDQARVADIFSGTAGTIPLRQNNLGQKNYDIRPSKSCSIIFLPQIVLPFVFS